jgi:hypothetical protein
MRVKPQLDATLRHYVLGELDEDTRGELEERLVTEPDLFELLGPTEDDLIEEYLENVLSPSEKAGFERHFLTNEERRSRLGFVRLLKNRASTTFSTGAEQTNSSLIDPIVQRPSDGAEAEAAGAMKAGGQASAGTWTALARSTRVFRLHPMWTGSLAACVAILLAGNAWFLFRSQSLGDELGRLRAEHQAERREQSGLQMRVDRALAQALQTELESARQQRATIEPRAALTQTQQARPTGAQAPPLFVLATGILRGEGGEMTRIAIPPDAPLIRLRLELSREDYPLYRAVLYDAQADEIWMQSKVAARSGDGRTAVTVVLPSELLPRGDYHIKLSGIDQAGLQERVAAYSFRVTAP